MLNILEVARVLNVPTDEATKVLTAYGLASINGNYGDKVVEAVRVCERVIRHVERLPYLESQFFILQLEAFLQAKVDAAPRLRPPCRGCDDMDWMEYV